MRKELATLIVVIGEIEGREDADLKRISLLTESYAGELGLCREGG